MFVGWKAHSVKISAIPKLIYKSMKSTAIFFGEKWQANSKMYIEVQRIKNNQENLKEEPNWMTY